MSQKQQRSVLAHPSVTALAHPSVTALLIAHPSVTDPSMENTRHKAYYDVLLVDQYVLAYVAEARYELGIRLGALERRVVLRPGGGTHAR